MFIEVGPASLAIRVERGGADATPDREWLEGRVGAILRDIGSWLPVLRQRTARIVNAGRMGPVPRTMVEAASAVDGATLTPMAAVAGAVSDALRADLMGGDPDFISVNNGGDVSVFCRGGKAVRAGIGDIAKGLETPYVIVVDGFHRFGMATSGFGGRSFTLGIADAVTVVAPSSALADAAATYIGNMTDVVTNRVRRKRAAEIDALTDIPDEMVTVEVGELTGDEIERALEKGLAAARALKGKGVILDAVILLRHAMVATVEDRGQITLEVRDEDTEDRYYR